MIFAEGSQRRRQPPRLAVEPPPGRAARRRDHLHHPAAARRDRGRRASRDALGPDDRRAFLDEMVPKLVAYHRWLFRDRRLDGSPLVTLIHPWECGLDSTPPWMHALRAWRMPWCLRVAERLHLARLLRSLRYDTRYLPATERASDDDGLRMLALAIHARRYDFDLRRMPRDRVGADRGRRVQRVLRRRQPRAPIAGRGPRRARAGHRRARGGDRGPVARADAASTAPVTR